MIGIGVLGAGFMGTPHARAFAGISDVRVVGIFSRSADKAAALAEEVGAEPFSDPMKLATDPRVDAVSVTLPTQVHKEFVVAALEAGKHVLVEKPMAVTVEECDAMIAAAQRNKRILMVAHVLRYWPEYVALVQYVKSGALGKPLIATAKRLAGPPRWAEYYLHPEWSGGGVVDMQIHDVDTLNWLFGTPKTVYARGQRSPETGGWDVALTLVDYGDVRGFAEASVMQAPEYPFTMGLSVLCERGSVEYSFRAGGVQVDSRDQAGTSLMVYEAGKEPRPLAFTPGDAYVNEVRSFAECVRTGRPPADGTGAQGRLALATALAARESIETGQVVSF
jgi:UDP-N-acetylglucosamine 3-dehydrogenase